MVTVLLSLLLKRCFVSCMRDLFLLQLTIYFPILNFIVNGSVLYCKKGMKQTMMGPMGPMGPNVAEVYLKT